MLKCMEDDFLWIREMGAFGHLMLMDIKLPPNGAYCL